MLPAAAAIPSGPSVSRWAGPKPVQALAAEEGERRRVSRDLHDGVGQRLTGVLLTFQRVEAAAPEAGGPELRAVRDEVRASLEEVRDTARRLRPEALEGLGLTAALAALTRDVGRGAPLTVERELRGDLDGLGQELDVVVYRIAQEALTNVVRHAGARGDRDGRAAWQNPADGRADDRDDPAATRSGRRGGAHRRAGRADRREQEGVSGRRDDQRLYVAGPGRADGR
jgi:two-component system sensor histidine kinase UhpB